MKVKYFLFFIIFVLIKQATVKAQNNKMFFGNNVRAGHYLKTRGIKLYYETYGQGQPLLMIHGNGGSIDNFKNQIPYFAKNYRVIVADSRAQGKTIDNRDSLSYEMMADDLNALLDSLHLKQCYIIGWSDGGINGLLMAMRHPDKVKKLAITGANLWPDSTALAPAVFQFMADQKKQMDDSLRRMKNPSAEFKNSKKLLELMIYQPHITLEQLHHIKSPTLVIGGDHDAIPPQHTMQIALAIPQSYLWILPNSGHSTLINYRDEFNKTVSNFFSKPYRKIEGTDRFN
ncbi:alpha/beta hydrolase [Mucilaginibacter sp. Bleaf8]|uniref:alpha/beta fold hydrolase n=1 Tax=Mucilaginibacter sp. Bleaf8 TaxID=2834430 RepID=UPI001BCBB1A5|nr:alpha/beta hydrolase [Mucilaginibacter sp. Bleaf8]MBS7564225.1 alpha/beta hydrolase [Mucilaginibacter sp. Bleaf8]